MIDTGKLLAVTVCNNKIILLPFLFSPCAYLMQVYIFGWLFRTFRTFLRFEGKFDCRFFENFLWSFLAWKKTISQSVSLLFLPFFCTLLTGDEESRCGCLHERNHACSSKKGMFWVHFSLFLLMNIDSLFLIRILTFSFPFFQTDTFLRVSGRTPRKTTSASIAIITHFMGFGQGPPWSSTGVAAEVTFFQRSPTTGGLRLILWHFKMLSETMFPETEYRFLTFCSYLFKYYNHYSHRIYQISFCCHRRPSNCYCEPCW